MLIDTLRACVAILTRALPGAVHKRKRWRKLNRFFNRLGATPLVFTKMKDGTSLQIDLRATSQIQAYYSGAYEPELVQTVLALYDGQGAFLDAGANIGLYTTAVAAHLRRDGNKGRVIACEPLAANVERLRRNLQQNTLLSRCVICEIGLSDLEQTLSLTLREDFGSGATTGNASVAINNSYDAGFAKVPIALTTLDALWPTLAETGSRLDFIKVDIEGHEDRFFAGAINSLASQRPAILMEVNRAYYNAKDVDLDTAIFRCLPHGYQLFRRNTGRWRRAHAFAECACLEDVLLVPEERRALARYATVLFE